ncbi:HDIG domain-containing protein [Candidatus Gottesmanbacteria bacterium]|nr:HDIG domain-containing protein [Candidatus Gottesmanbacteria bacterium]
MIPTEEQAKALWQKYQLPERKRKHVQLVARIANYLANKVDQLGKFGTVDKKLLTAGALLHDIDKNIPRLPGEQHPDTAVRILKEEGMEEVANLVKTHSLHAILDPTIAPKTWEEKVLFLADKMVKDDIIGVDKRFRLWNEEHLPADAQKILDEAYPKVKALEQEIFDLIGLVPEDLAKLA